MTRKQQKSICQDHIEFIESKIVLKKDVDIRKTSLVTEHFQTTNEVFVIIY